VGLFLKIYNSAVPCIVQFTGHLLSDEILLAVWEWEWEENGNKTRLNLGSGMGMNHWEWD